MHRHHHPYHRDPPVSARFVTEAGEQDGQAGFLLPGLPDRRPVYPQR